MKELQSTLFEITDDKYIHPRVYLKFGDEFTYGTENYQLINEKNIKRLYDGLYFRPRELGILWDSKKNSFYMYQSSTGYNRILIRK